jgi:hypothetical protein
MGIMKKIAPITAALALAAGTLFGNPLESTVLKEDNKSEMVDFVADANNSGFSLNLSLPMVNEWSVNFASDVTFAESSSPPRVNNVDTVVGNDRFYAGFSYGDLSTESLLQYANILKVQTGLRPFDWLDFSATGAIVNLPKNNIDISALGYPVYQIPLTLYAIGGNIDIGKKFALNKSLSLFPWLSVVASGYFASPQNNDDFQMINTSSPTPGLDSSSMAFPFDHLNVQGGVDLDFNDHLKLSYKGTYDGEFYPIFNFTNMVGIQMHNEDKMSLEYDVSLITLPTLASDGLLDPTRNELQFDLSGFYLLDSGLYFKASASALVDFLTQNQFNATAAVGWRFKNSGNLEAYFSSQFNPENASQNNVFGIQYSTKLDKSTNKESKARNAFMTSNGISNPSIPGGSQNANSLQQRFGATLNDAVSNIHSEQDLSNLESYIVWKDHDGTFSAEEEYKRGYGVCRDTNGNLMPYIESRAFDYKSVRPITLRGAYVSHVITLIETKDSKFDIRNYDQFYSINAPTPKDAVNQVFPGEYIEDDGTRTTAVTAVNNAVEKPLYDWTKFRKD